MSNINKFDPEDLDLNALNEVLQSLSDYYISKRRLNIRASEKTLGVGGFGTVKLADLWPTIWIPFVTLPTTVAVKELRTDNRYGTPLRIAVRLAREIKVWASCKHDNILEFTGYYLSNDFGTAYLVSPYMANGNMKDYLSREAPSQMRRLKLVLDTIKGLAYLHSRTPPIVHGDLKSLNVLLNNQGEALLCDLGLAKAMEDKSTGLSTSNGFKGTIRYASPEVLNGSPRDRPSDIWAWGCLALEIITGNPPYHECQTGTQVLVLICGPQDHRRTPEPSDISSLPFTALDLLRMCWSFEAGQRPDGRQCVDTMHSALKLNSSDLPTHLYIPPARLDFSLLPKDRSDWADGTSVARPVLQDPNEVVMVKLVRICDISDFERLARVTKLWASCQHNNILEFIGYHLSQDFRTAYLVSPCMANGNIKDYLSREAPSSMRRLALVLDTINGLAYLHSRAPPIVHGNLKSLNVLVNNKGEALLCDLGLAKTIEDKLTALSTSNGFKGTIRYASPEVLNGSPRDCPSDIWAWGCLALEIITGNPPYHECQTETQVLVLIGGPQDHRRTPEPSDVSSLPFTALDLLRMCWSFEAGQRPDGRQCADTMHLALKLNSSDLPTHLYIPPARLDFLLPPKDWSDWVDGHQENAFYLCRFCVATTCYAHLQGLHRVPRSRGTAL